MIVLFACDVEAGSDLAGYINAGTNNVIGYTPTLTSLFVNGATEDGAAVFDATALSTYFEAPTFVGAVTSGDMWYTGWTCDSATVDLDGDSACTSLPVY